MLNTVSNLLPGNNLQKATLTILETRETIPCQFNPQEFSVTRTVSWSRRESPSLNSPVMEYRGSAPTVCQMNLFFDTTDSGSDVRAYTNQLMRLTLKGAGGPQKKGVFTKPPVVSFVWGKFQLFKAVVTSLNVAYTMFLPDGTPVRARCEVTFTQNDHDDDPLSAQNPTTRTEPRKTRVVQAGERIDNIANEEYGHPRYWRMLAAANNLDHVENLSPGLVLMIPPLDQD
jgi:hypothetical protein